MISIIIPVFNNSHFLDKCISSVVEQTYRDLEIILVDDGSTDGSGEICDRWARIDRRIIVIHQNNSGVSAARNRGICTAKGDYILLLDSDDALSIDTCSRIVEYAEYQVADCVIFGFKQETGTIWAPEQEYIYPSLAEFKTDFVVWLNTELLSSSVNKLYRRELILTLFPVNISFGEDLVFSINYIKNCERICFVPWPLYLHNNVNECSLTHSMRLGKILDIECWQREIIQFVGGDETPLNLYDKYLKDTLLWLKRFYASKQYANKVKKRILRHWFSGSYLKTLPLACGVDMVDRIVIFCLKCHLWLLPARMLGLKHIITGKNRCQ